METSDLNVLTPDQMELLLAVFKDCREFYQSRAQFDTDYKLLKQATLIDLYQGWKGINAYLVSGTGSFRAECLSNWWLTAGSSQREVRAYRQLLGLYSRLNGHCDTTEALSNYRLRVANARGTCPKNIQAIAQNLIKTWLGPCPVLSELHPHHGPGAVAEGLKDPREKQYFKYIYRQLRPYGGASLLYLHDKHMLEEPHHIVEQAHPITRVVAVPKDLVKPRIISCEPLTMQFLQQGLCRYLMATLEHSCPYLRFRDQTHNAILARRLDVATLDMSDASDTVSRRIVWNLFPDDWRRLLFALRSHFASVAGEHVPLRAFAPMGSALCFPVESIVFAAVTVASIVATMGVRFVKANKTRIAIYGDDIIIPIEVANDVLMTLRASGFVPNERKCCIQGRFRESCGAEWYEGFDVTVVRPRSLNPRDISTDRFLSVDAMPMALHAKALYCRGFLCAAQFLAKRCDFPVAIGDRDGYMPADLPWKQVGRLRYNARLQRMEQQVLLPVQVAKPSDAGTGYSALFLHLCYGWSSEQVSVPWVKPKNRWVLAAPLSER